MSDFLIWFAIVAFAWIPLSMLVVFLPIHLYNIAWLAFTQRNPVLPVTGANNGAGNSRAGYYRLSGIVPKVYGIICLLFGLSTHTFIIDFFYHFDPDQHVTSSQKIELGIWLATLGPLASASHWVPTFSASAERMFDKQKHRPFFWAGLIAKALSMMRRVSDAGRRFSMK